MVTLRILAMAARPLVSLPMTFFFWPRSLSMLTAGAKVHAQVGHVADLVHDGCHMQQRLDGMQPTFRHTPPRVA